MTHHFRHISVTIDRPLAEVYAFAGDPANLPRWAAGLGLGIEREGAKWKVRTPDGFVLLRFAARNEWGVMDHTVELPDGGEVYVPFRAVANGTGTEVTLGLLRQPEMDDAVFERDAGLMRDDLLRLKMFLENR
jgi:hypothetical protein